MRLAFLLPLLGLAACTTRPDLGLIEPPPQSEADGYAPADMRAAMAWSIDGDDHLAAGLHGPVVVVAVLVLAGSEQKLVRQFRCSDAKR